MRIGMVALALFAASTALAAERESPPWATRDLKAGIIGTDNGHSVVTSGHFNNHTELRIKVVAAYKDGSPDMPFSADRIDGISEKVRANGVEFVDSIEELLKRVDVVLIHSVDGRPHLAQATLALRAGKPLFIDKPLAARVADAKRIVEISKETGTPFFSASTMRFRGNIPQLRAHAGVGKVLKVEGINGGFGLMNGAYGIHEMETAYGVLGAGCVSVMQTKEDGQDVVTGKWKDGRILVLHPRSQDKRVPRLRVIGTEGSADFQDGGGTYGGLVQAIAEFLHTGKPPVDPDESVEVIEFMVAAQLSKERGGVEVSLEEVQKPPIATRLEATRKRSAKAPSEQTKE